MNRKTKYIIQIAINAFTTILSICLLLRPTYTHKPLVIMSSVFAVVCFEFWLMGMISLRDELRAGKK